MHNQSRSAFGLKQEGHLLWTRDRFLFNWEKFVNYQVRANETYSEAKHQFSLKNTDDLMNTQPRHKSWFTTNLLVVQSALFGSSSSLPLLAGGGDGLVCESVGKVYLLSDNFDSKQSRKSVDLPFTCYWYPSLTTFAFRQSEVRRLLLDLDPYGGTDPLCMFPLFLMRTADVLVSCHSVVYLWLLNLGSFLASCRQANATKIPKSQSSSSVANYQPILRVWCWFV